MNAPLQQTTPIASTLPGGFDDYELQLGTTATLIDAEGDFTVLQLGAGETVTFGDGIEARFSVTDDLASFTYSDRADVEPWVARSSELDLGDRPWTTREVTIFPQGDVVIDQLNDDGTRLERSIFDELVQSEVRTDPNDVAPWERIETRYENDAPLGQDPRDGNSVLAESTTFFDDSTIGVTTYDEGVIAAFTITDPDDVAPFESYRALFEDGELAQAFATLDDGVVIATSFRDGALVGRTQFDPDDARPWLVIEERFEEGTLVESTTVFDDGDVVVA